MKQIFIGVLALFIFSVGLSPVYAQTNKKAPSSTTKKKSSVMDDKKSKKGTDKSMKDGQNQMKFMKPDINATEYNFYDRKKISTPLMPRYDLDSMAFQKGNKRKKQQASYLQNKYHYPSRPKDQWDIGVNFGLAVIAGDIRPALDKVFQNVGVGFTVRKSIGYVFSLRMAYNYYLMTGLNDKPNTGLLNNNTLGNNHDLRENNVDSPSAQSGAKDSKFNYGLGGYAKKPGTFYNNYRTNAHQIALEGLVSVGNLLFHKERNRLGLYLFGGLGFTVAQTKYDALDKNGQLYDFRSTDTIWNTGTIDNVSGRSKKILNDLEAKLDGTYETYADQDNYSSFLGHYQILPSATAGFGISYHVAKFMTIGVEEKVTFTGSDLLDGQRWTEQNTFTSDKDLISYTALTLNFHVGKNRVEPLYWLNPMDYAYKKLGDVNPEKMAKDILKDSDEDGVPDRLDKEPNSKKGCPVDVKGVVLDSDKDGIADCDDKEPFSPPGYTIDQYGVAQVPPSPCCDQNDTSGGMNGLAGGKNGKGRRGGSNFDCGKIELPGVYYDADRYDIGPEYYGALHQVAERLQMCPDVKMLVNGFDESKNDQKYNEQLAYNRATSVVDYLVEKYGISRDRFVVKYQGGKKAAAGKSPNEMKKGRKVDIGYVLDGDKGESNPPAPHPGLKAGSNK
jgi:outer membrane protein OmpA-like peptidoglycan-associated protein